MIKDLSSVNCNFNKAIILPCLVGDTLWSNLGISGFYLRAENKPYPVKVVFIGINDVDNFINVEYKPGKMWQFNFSQIGKTIFLTKEDALRALAVENEQMD